MGLRSSRYNFASTAVSGAHLLFNGVTGALFELEEAEWFAATALLGGRAAPAASAPELDEIRSQLTAGGFLVEEGSDDLGVLLRRREAALASEAVLELEISPTWACNASCTYCFVPRRASRMGAGVALSVREFLRRNIPRHEETRLTWSGGEPLLCSEVVVEMTGVARDAAAEAGTRLFVTVLSNGLLLDLRRARALEAAGVTHVHVTLDGLAGTHDRARPAADGKPSWDRTMSNIQGLLEATDGLTVNLRANVDTETISGAYALLDAFDAGHRARMQIDLSPVFRPIGPNGQVPAPAVEIQRELALLARRALLLGYRVLQPRLQPKALFCSAEGRAAIRIGPDGSLMKCHDPGIPEAFVGRLDAEGRECWNSRQDAWYSAQANILAAECRQCQLLCFCGGGCRLKRLRQSASPDCRSWFLDLEGLIANRHLEAVLDAQR